MQHGKIFVLVGRSGQCTKKVSNVVSSVDLREFFFSILQSLIGWKEIIESVIFCFGGPFKVNAEEN